MSSPRRTKIVATLGPATDPLGMVDSLIAAGMDCARLNCSHSDAEQLAEKAAEVRAASGRAGRPVALLFDLQGPKIRLTGDTPELDIVSGQPMRFTAAGSSVSGDLQVAFDDFTSLCTMQSQIVIGDGTPRFEVVAIGDGYVDAISAGPGKLGPRKGVNVTHAAPLLPALTEKDLADLQTAADLGADFVALSFVRHADDVLLLRREMERVGCNARVISKIEKVEAFENLASILKVSDGLMVARGDYGVEAGLAHVPRMQKETIHQAVEDGKVVITATQMLESMITSPEPTRAEALDVHNAVLDGTSAVMLSGETGVGAYPVQAVSMMAEIALIAEQSDIYCLKHGPRAENSDAAVMHAAVSLGRDTNAKAIIAPTTTGGTVRACAKYRPRRTIIGLCHNPQVANQLALEWGVEPALIPLTDNTEELVEVAFKAAIALGSVKSGDLVVITAGPSVGVAGATNIITLKNVP